MSVEITVNRRSFKHLVGVKEQWALSGAYKHKIITITRVGMKSAPLGFSFQKGDGISGKDGIFISRVLFGSVYDTCGLITLGDELLKVDELNVSEMNIAQIMQHMYDNKKFSITLKVMTPFARIQSRKRWAFSEPKSLIRQEDLKLLNMKIKIPKEGRHTYIEPETIEDSIEQPAEE